MLSKLTVLETETVVTMAALLPDDVPTRHKSSADNNNNNNDDDSIESDLPAKKKKKARHHAIDRTSTRKKGTKNIQKKKATTRMRKKPLGTLETTTKSVFRDRKDSSTRNTNTDKQLCTREQVGQGEWVPVRLDHAPYVTPTVHLRCYPRKHYYGPFYDTWAWQPYAAVQVVSKSTDVIAVGANEQGDDKAHDGDDNGADEDEEEENGDNIEAAAAAAADSCEFTEWQPDLFCRLLQSATIAIVGDSLSWEHYSSLIQLLGLRTRQGYQHQSRELQTNIQQAVCNGETAVVYRRDDKLTQLPSVWQQQQPESERYEHEATSTTTGYGHSSFPTILILNRGAHYVNDTMLLAGVRQNLVQVGEWMQECRALTVDCHFFWRTSVPGHAGCDNENNNENENNDYSRPVNDLQAMESRIANHTLYSEKVLKYHWYDYQHQNELVLKELARSGLDYNVLDAYRLNVLRPDGHRSHQGDCLHNCYPGKMDVYNQLLLHFLRRRISHKSVQQTVAVARKEGWKTNVTTVYDKEATEAAKEKRLRKKKKV